MVVWLVQRFLGEGVCISSWSGVGLWLSIPVFPQQICLEPMLQLGMAWHDLTLCLLRMCAPSSNTVESRTVQNYM